MCSWCEGYNLSKIIMVFELKSREGISLVLTKHKRNRNSNEFYKINRSGLGTMNRQLWYRMFRTVPVVVPNVGTRGNDWGLGKGKGLLADNIRGWAEKFLLRLWCDVLWLWVRSCSYGGYDRWPTLCGLVQYLLHTLLGSQVRLSEKWPRMVWIHTQRRTHDRGLGRNQTHRARAERLGAKVRFNTGESDIPANLRGTAVSSHICRAFILPGREFGGNFDTISCLQKVDGSVVCEPWASSGGSWIHRLSEKSILGETASVQLISPGNTGISKSYLDRAVGVHGYWSVDKLATPYL
jgi:hypothetical protein